MESARVRKRVDEWIKEAQILTLRLIQQRGSGGPFGCGQARSAVHSTCRASAGVGLTNDDAPTRVGIYDHIGNRTVYRSAQSALITRLRKELTCAEAALAARRCCRAATPPALRAVNQTWQLGE